MNELGRNNAILLHSAIPLVSKSSAHSLIDTKLWLSSCTVMTCAAPVVRIDTYSIKRIKELSTGDTGMRKT